ncbi:MAG: hypothetical protein K9I85_13480 [Saprospiraceae bacterium]|nr:hypothetical protein [Saprospiraceae bacterium]
MRRIIASIPFLFFCLLTGYGQASRSIVQAFNPYGAMQVVLDLPGEVELLLAPGELIQIETEVKLLNAGDPILKALIHAMRYSLVSEKEDGNLMIRQANRLTPVSVRGLELQESYRFKVYLPKDIQVAIADPAVDAIPAESFELGTNSK